MGEILRDLLRQAETAEPQHKKCYLLFEERRDALVNGLETGGPRLLLDKEFANTRDPWEAEKDR